LTVEPLCQNKNELTSRGYCPHQQPHINRPQWPECKECYCVPWNYTTHWTQTAGASPGQWDKDAHFKHSEHVLSIYL